MRVSVGVVNPQMGEGIQKGQSLQHLVEQFPTVGGNPYLLVAIHTF